MPKFGGYVNKYLNVKMKQCDGSLHATLHVDDKELVWSLSRPDEVGDGFSDMPVTVHQIKATQYVPSVFQVW